MADEVERRLQALGLELPPALNRSTPRPYDRSKRVGNLLFVSGHGPTNANGEAAFTGQVGRELGLEQASEAAKLCALGCLAAVKAAVGSLDAIVEVVTVRGFVSSDPGFVDQGKVMDGASAVLVAALGDRGRHSRTTIGVPVLPGNIPVEVDMLVVVEG
jgi:enamine deaminase RidA (YjgF/YER057c/UK114 family)